MNPLLRLLMFLESNYDDTSLMANLYYRLVLLSMQLGAHWVSPLLVRTRITNMVCWKSKDNSISVMTDRKMITELGFNEVTTMVIVRDDDVGNVAIFMHKKFVDAIRESKHDVLVWNVDVHVPTSPTSTHSNLFIFDRQTLQLYMIDPHGNADMFVSSRKHIARFMTDVIGIRGVMCIPPKYACPTLQLQTVRLDRNSGICQYWSWVAFYQFMCVRAAQQPPQHGGTMFKENYRATRRRIRMNEIHKTGSSGSGDKQRSLQTLEDKLFQHFNTRDESHPDHPIRVMARMFCDLYSDSITDAMMTWGMYDGTSVNEQRTIELARELHAYYKNNGTLDEMVRRIRDPNPARGRPRVRM